MNAFIRQHAKSVIGILRGWDRLRFRGTVRMLANLTEGLIAVVTAVESCNSYNVRSNRQRGLLELYPQPRKCQHLYHYMIHPVFGHMYVRLQTWFPFNLFVGLNGREWLSRQMDAAAIDAGRRGRG